MTNRHWARESHPRVPGFLAYIGLVLFGIISLLGLLGLSFGSRSHRGGRRLLPVPYWLRWFLLSLGMAQADLSLREVQHYDTLPPMIQSFRQDSGTALDLMAHIEFHQTPAAEHGQALLHGHAQQAHDEQFRIGHELDILLDYVNEQNFIFYRADPMDTLRPREIGHSLRESTTIEEVRDFIYQIWPDLRNGRWELLPVASSWHTSPQSTANTIPLLVWASADLLSQDGSACITLVEHQEWDLATTMVKVSLTPISMWKQTDIPAWIQFLGFRQLCQNSPCAVRQNGHTVGWRRQIRGHDAQHITLFTVEDPSQIRRIIVPPADPEEALVSNVPTWFGAQAMVVAQQYWPDVDQVFRSAKALQISLSQMAQSIYRTTGLMRLTTNAVAVATPRIGEVDFTMRLHQVHRDPFGLYYDLLAAGLASETAAWTIVPIHRSVIMSRLRPDFEYVGIYLQVRRPAGSWVMVLVEILWHEDPLTAPAIYHQLRWLPALWTGLSLPDYGLPIDNIDLCDLIVNGQPSPLPTVQRVQDGAFAHLSCYPREHRSLSHHVRITVSNSTTSEAPASSKRPRLSQPSSSTGTPSVPPAGLDVAMAACLLLLVRLSRQLWQLPDMVNKRKAPQTGRTMLFTSWTRSGIFMALVILHRRDC